MKAKEIDHQIASKKGKIKIDPKTLQYNKLIKLVEQLENKKNQVADNLEKAYSFNRIHIEKMDEQIILQQLQLVKTLFKAIPQLKLSKKYQEFATLMLIESLEEIGEVIELDEESQQIYDVLAPYSYKEVQEANEFMEKMRMQDFFKYQGIQIDWSKFSIKDFAKNDPVKMAEFMNEIEKQHAANNEKFENKKQHQKKEKAKTKKQRETEQIAKQKENIENKSIKELYTSLAKILHPDKELNEDLKLEKEEWMKRLTEAYQKKDLATLIQIETHWLKEDKFDPIKVSNEKFQIYMKFLKERIYTLEVEIDMVRMNPKFSGLEEFALLGPTELKQELENMLQLTVQNLEFYKELTALLNNSDKKLNKIKKKEVMHYIDNFFEGDEDIFGEMSFFDGDF